MTTKARASTLDLSGVTGIGGGIGINVLTIAGVVNDGSADVTSYIQAYIDSLPNNIPTLLYFPQGTYLITSLKLGGTGGAKVVSIAGQSKEASLIYRIVSDTLYASMILAGPSRSYITNLTLDYNYSLPGDAAPTGNQGCCIYGANFITVSGCFLNAPKYACINSDGTNQQARITNNQMSSNGVVIRAGGWTYESVLSNNYITCVNGQYGILLTGCDSVVMRDNLILDYGTALTISIVASCNNILIVGNKITNSANSTIGITNSSGVNIGDNYITPGVNSAGVSFIGLSSFCTVRNNNFTQGYNVIQLLNGNTNITIAQNNIQSAGQYGIYLDSGGGANNSYVSIVNNTIVKTQKAGIAILSADYGIIIQGNSITDPNMAAGNAAPVNSGIYTIGLAGHVISGNTIVGSNVAGHGYPTFGIYTSSTSIPGTVLGNTCSLYRVANYSLGTCLSSVNV